MDLGGRRKGSSTPKSGSIWESRMRLDEFKGGIKVFNATTHQNSEQNVSVTVEDKKQSSTSTMKPKQSPIGKRKTWKSEGGPVQISKQRSELSNNLDKECKELIKVSVDGIRKSRSVNVGIDQSSDGNEKKDEIQLRKVKSDSTEELNCDLDLKKVLKSETSDEDLKKSVSLQLVKSKVENVSQIETPIDGEEEEKEEEEEDELNNGEGEEEKDEEIEVEIEEKTLQIKEISLQEQRPNKTVIEEKKLIQSNPNKTVIEEKKLIQSNEKTVQFSPIVKKKAPSTVNHAKIHPNPTKTKPIPVSDHLHGIPRTHSKLQSVFDLVMWRDVSKSAFIFGIGTFFIISSSYTKDLNISFISVISYLGLVYLAAIFLFRSLITRGSNDMGQEYVVGEEEAIWVIKLVLPYLNEFLLKLRALFSGDPATTMKLAVILFILARCGSSITIWKMAKLGFFGVFTVPKICCSYSSQLTAYGTFWIRRFGDAWESCSHKKAVGFAIFTLVWNLSSVVARIWAVFMLFVAFKYYKHSLTGDGWARSTHDHHKQNKLGRTEIRKQKKFS